ncbi:methionine synthase [Umezawaea tangerina]|uniref:Cobalamin-independent methionine synthase catalytic subunit n=1 Tax=Umezawaea tangerina TaxID=84725 RepID=A0A2T0TAW9_9PSEU|nr:methionine synthase [Umezawaea tangerina]PRY42807.1 cobalamin-independent methionine synthase catalytic subunit [Umezawaea tangerina]
MNTTPWKPGSATGIGSLPGTDPHEASRIVLGELPLLPHLPELPDRGVGADIVGRTAGLLVDIPVEVVPSGYRVTAHPGRDHRRAVDLMRYDLDAFEEAFEGTNLRAEVVKIQVAGPWTLMSNVELVRGHRVLTDPGAVKEFTESLAEGLRLHIAEVVKRTGAQVVVQLDEPGLPAVLEGLLPTPSKLGTVRAVPAPDARDVLATIVEAAGPGVIVHCCAPKPPVTLLREAGAAAVALDVSLLRGAGPAVLDELGEAWQAGTSLWLGLVPSTDPGTEVTLRKMAKPALELADRLGFPRTVLSGLALPTPSCGLAGASDKWVRRALALTRDLGKAFLEPPEDW